MHQKDKKLAVLHKLSQLSEPVSLTELLAKLGNEYRERSVRRWLAEMVQEGVIRKIGRKKSSLYQIIERADRIKMQQNSLFSFESAKIIEKIRLPIYERYPNVYADTWLQQYEPNVTFYIPLAIRQQLEQAGRRLERADPAGTYAHQIFNRLLIDLSYNSSRLEGNTYSLIDTERLVLSGKSAHGKLQEEAVMILNHKEAIRYLVYNAARINISDETIFTIHYLLSDGLVEHQYAGKIRDYAVRISGSTYMPFESKIQLQTRFSIILQKAAVINNPYEQSIFLLAHITYLQMFVDVNKRTARLSANIPLIKNNFVPLSFNDVERDDYTAAIIAIYELQDIRPLLDLYIFSYMRTCALYDATTKILGFDEVRVRYRQERREIIRHIILHKLTAEAMHAYIKSAAEIITIDERVEFIKDIMEDLNYIDYSYLAGLGITSQELDTWKKICEANKD